MVTACCHCCRPAAAGVLVLALVFSVPPHAEETAALRLLRSIQALQAEHGSLAPEILPPLLELGQLYAAGQCDRALDILDLALEVSRRADGVLNRGQLEIFDALIHCHITLDQPAELKRAQEYVLLIHEAAVGRDDPRLLPALERIAETYEEVGLYLSARRLYRRAIDIAERHAGPYDLSLVEPLRGMARAFRLEYAYDLVLPDRAAVDTERTALKSRAVFSDTRGARVDRLGQRSLKRAVDILRRHPNADRRERLDTLLELGDWYLLADDSPNALRLYREAWHELAVTDPQAERPARIEAPAASNNRESDNSLDFATKINVRPATGTPLRRPPLERPDHVKYTVELEFTVTRNGLVESITVIKSNAPPHIDKEAMEDLRRLRYRPRFLNGEPVDTPGLHHHSNIYVKRPPAFERVAGQ